MKHRYVISTLLQISGAQILSAITADATSEEEALGCAMRAVKVDYPDAAILKFIVTEPGKCGDVDHKPA